MAQYQQQQVSEARATLTAGREFVRQKLDSYQGVNWHDKIIAQTLMAEAGALIQPSPSPVQSEK